MYIYLLFFEVVNASFKIELIPTLFEIIIGQWESKIQRSLSKILLNQTVYAIE
jgi:hypothetical protein